jgi:hypothetical protein
MKEASDMERTTTVLQMWVRGVGAIMILLGVLIWTGHFDKIIPIHETVGITLVLALWGLAGLGAVNGVNRGLVAVAFVWGLIVPILGLTQTQILPSSGHWLIQILHLLVGIAAIGQGDTLGRNIKRQLSTSKSAKQADALRMR